MKQKVYAAKWWEELEHQIKERIVQRAFAPEKLEPGFVIHQTQLPFEELADKVKAAIYDSVEFRTSAA